MLCGTKQTHLYHQILSDNHSLPLIFNNDNTHRPIRAPQVRLVNTPRSNSSSSLVYPVIRSGINTKKFSTNSLQSSWRICRALTSPELQEEALLIVSKHTNPETHKVETDKVSQYFSERYGMNWHCIAGTHQTAWRVWYDQPNMLWMENGSHRVMLFRRDPLSPAPSPRNAQKMHRKFPKIAGRILERWQKDPNVQRPMVLREELCRKWGGWWHCVVGRDSEFQVSSALGEGSLGPLLTTKIGPYAFVAWLG
jgi:hypothetical protein